MKKGSIEISEEDINRAKAGDQASWEKIYRFTCQLVQRKAFSFQYTLQRREPEDVLHEVLISIYDSLDQYDGRGFSSWVNTTVRNRFFDFGRKDRVKREDLRIEEMSPQQFADFSPRNSEKPTTERTMIARESLSIAFRGISKKDRLLFLQKESEGFSMKELSEAHGENESTLKVKLLRVRRKARENLERLDTKKPRPPLKGSFSLTQEYSQNGLSLKPETYSSSKTA